MKLIKNGILSAALLVGFISASKAETYKIEYEHPDASQIVKKDIPPGPTLYAIPENCKLTSAKFIEKMAPKGQKLFNNRKIANCVACHNAPGSKGAGNIGPDLTAYTTGLMKAPGVRGEKKTIDWVFQRVADYRVQIPEKYRDPHSKEFVPYYNIMTVNLTTKALTYDQVCAITAFLLSLK